MGSVRLVGNYSDHCDFDSTCLTTWLPKAFLVMQYLWVLTAFAGAVGIALAIALGWRRLAVIALGVGWSATFLIVGVTPIHGGGDPMNMGIFTGDPFFYGSFPWYRLMGIIVGASSLVLGTLLCARSPERRV